MHVVLIAPPPWRIPADGEAAVPPEQGGPPRGREDLRPGGDFLGPPYGLMSLAAQARRAGHEVTTLNMTNFPWSEVERVVGGLEASLFGISCFTANRRGAMVVAEAIRQRHPDARIVMGGPHASALPAAILERHPAVDAIVIGEGEATFLELCAQIAAGRSPRGISGTAWREDGVVSIGPPRPPIADLDSLASVHELFPTPFVLTSRGCTGRCTFCGSQAIWGRGVRAHSAERVLDTLETIVRVHRNPLVAVKDDTFTASRRRALEICRGIEARGLRFLWLCDTRADSLARGGEELVEAMRRAGCVQVSLGVESGAQAVLERLQKQITVDQVRRATRLAKSVGLRVRYYLILGSPGETLETIGETFELIRSERPHQVVFTPLSTYPGTEEYRRLVDGGHLRPEEYLDEDFWRPTWFADVDAKTKAHLEGLLKELPGIGQVCRPTVEECRAAVERLPDVAANYVELAAALLEDGQLAAVGAEVERARELGFPLSSICENLLACVAARRDDVAALCSHLEAAAEGYPLRAVTENLSRFRAWERQGDPDLAAPDLVGHVSYELAEAMVQPMNPGPIELPKPVASDGEDPR